MGATSEVVKQNRRQFASALNQIMGRWKFAPDAKKGRPKNTANVGRPRTIDPSVVMKLEEAFSFGCGVNEAISYAGIAKPQYYEWLEINPAFQDRIAELQANPIIRARKSVFARMKFDADLALKFLERKLPDEFSLKATVRHDVEFSGIAIDRPKVIEQIGENEPPQIEQAN